LLRTAGFAANRSLQLYRDPVADNLEGIGWTPMQMQMQMLMQRLQA
jgi:hypothetical protein